MTDEETEVEVHQLPDGQWDAHVPGTLFGGTFTSRGLALESAREFVAERLHTHRYTYARTEARIDERGWESREHIYRCECGFEVPSWYVFSWEVDGHRRPGVRS